MRTTYRKSLSLRSGNNSWYQKKGDVIKETWKYAWRRIVYYVFFFGLLVYLRHASSEIENFSTWIWIVNILWFDIDVKSEKNMFLVRLIHGMSFTGSFMSAIMAMLMLILDKDYISERTDMDGGPYVAWLILVWMNFLPPVWVVIDLYLHREDILKCHNIRIPPNTARLGKICRLVLQVFWILVSSPVLGAIWILSNCPPDSFKLLILDNSSESGTVFFSVVLVSNTILAILLISFIRKIKGKRSRLGSMQDLQQNNSTDVFE